MPPGLRNGFPAPARPARLCRSQPGPQQPSSGKTLTWQAGPAVSSKGSRPLTWLAVACHMPIRTWSGCAPSSAGSATAARARARHRRAQPGHHPGLGSARAGDHRHGRGPAVRSRRAGVVPAPPPARGSAGRAEPAAGHRVLRVGPGRDPHRGDPAGPALPVGRRLRPARDGLPGPPYEAQGQRARPRIAASTSPTSP
jgi:hypothetical protein